MISDYRKDQILSRRKFWMLSARTERHSSILMNLEERRRAREQDRRVTSERDTIANADPFARAARDDFYTRDRREIFTTRHGPRAARFSAFPFPLLRQTPRNALASDEIAIGSIRITCPILRAGAPAGLLTTARVVIATRSHFTDSPSWTHSFAPPSRTNVRACERASDKRVASA